MSPTSDSAEASRASKDAMFAIGAVLVSVALVLATPHVGKAGTVAGVVGLIVAPISLVLAWIAMAGRARCPDPRPKLPVVALALSIVYFVLLAGSWAFLWGLGHMH